jgi:penicillin-binding protein 2
VIEKIVGKSGTASFSFKPEQQGELPLKPENLALIQEAMKAVPTSRKPMGTAFRELNDLDIPIAGKTGTATSSSIEPHAWFGGYTFANQADKPDIAVVVIAENSGEGSEIAAPIFRRVVEIYFYGRPLKLYKWEAMFDVTRSPTPEFTEVPTVQPNINP